MTAQTQQAANLPAQRNGLDRRQLAGMAAGQTAQVAFAPTDMPQLIEVARMMSMSGPAVPKHLRENPGACMSVCMVAYQNAMNPFLLAGDSYEVNGTLAYGAKAMVSMLYASGMIEGRLHYDLAGQWPKRGCTVTGTIRGESEPRTLTVQAETITVRNSPLWKAQPDVQLQYYAGRAWARLYVPEALLGAISADEVEHRGPDRARDVTPQAQDPVANLAAEIAQIEAQGEAVDTQTGEITETEAEELTSDASDSAPSGPEEPAEELGSDPLAAWRVEPPEDDADETAWKRAYAAVSEHIKAAQSPADAQAIEAANGEVIEAIEARLKGWGRRLYAEIDKRKAG